MIRERERERERERKRESIYYTVTQFILRTDEPITFTNARAFPWMMETPSFSVAGQVFSP